jgi:cation diffusion facilitator family transporter
MPKISSKRAIVTSFLVDLGDVALNVTAMVITGSVVLLAEALEGGSDLVASGLLFVGLRISKKRADKQHPFGFGKALLSWTLLSAVVMLVFGGGLSFYFGLRRFLEPQDIEHIEFGYVTLCIAIVTNGYALSVSTRRLLENHPLRELAQLLINSSHVETKNTFILDLTGASAALVGLVSLVIYQVLDVKYFDGIGGMLMGVVIAISSTLLIWGVKDYLAGKRASAEIEKQIRDAALRVQQVKNILELTTMHMGTRKLLLHLDIEVDKSTTAKELGEIVDKVKRKIQKEVPGVTTIQIEVVPSGNGRNEG